MISLELPDDALMSHVVGAAQVEELPDNVVWGLGGVAPDVAQAPLQVFVSEFVKPTPPQVEVGARGPKYRCVLRTFSVYSMTLLSLRLVSRFCLFVTYLRCNRGYPRRARSLESELHKFGRQNAGLEGRSLYSRRTRPQLLKSGIHL